MTFGDWRRGAAVLSVALGTGVGAASAPAQHFDVAGQAILVLTRADPVPGGHPLTELRVVQPLLLLHGTAAAGRAWLHATLNGEGATIPNGELAMGDWGEGFVDRRHPHTTFHELMAGGRIGPVTLAAGKGFAPYGSDDPMSRPVLRYPVNHHLSQILERAMMLAAVTTGPVSLEAAVFNGDEPEHPSQWPKVDRVGDSWSARLTARPGPALELSASYADVHSPEHRPGTGPDDRKWHLAARWQRGGAIASYALVEWARTEEQGGLVDVHTLLAEGELRRGRSRGYARVERTERPEEARFGSPFRSQRPHLDNSIVGITRWTIGTVGVGWRAALPWAELRAEPALELSAGSVRETTGAIFDPASFYGRDRFWSLTLALRLARGLTEHRMGRYGVSQRSAPAHH